MILVGWMSLEVWLFHLIATPIGVGWTLVWIFATGLIGILLLRLEGVRVLFRIYERLRQEELPTHELLDMGMVLMGAFLLVLPGFFTDFSGVLMLLPPVRWAVRGFFTRVMGMFAGRTQASGEVIEITPDD